MRNRVVAYTVPSGRTSMGRIAAAAASASEACRTRRAGRTADMVIAAPPVVAGLDSGNSRCTASVPAAAPTGTRIARSPESRRPAARRCQLLPSTKGRWEIAAHRRSDESGRRDREWHTDWAPARSSAARSRRKVRTIDEMKGHAVPSPGGGASTGRTGAGAGHCPDAAPKARSAVLHILPPACLPSGAVRSDAAWDFAGVSGALRSFLHARGGAPDDPALAGRGDGGRLGGWGDGGKERGMLDADALDDLLRRVEEDEIRQTADPKRDGK